MDKAIKSQDSPTYPKPRKWEIAYPSGASAIILGVLKLVWIEDVGCSPVIEVSEKCAAFGQQFDDNSTAFLDPRADIRFREGKKKIRVYNARRYFDLIDKPFQEYLVDNPNWPTAKVDREEDAFPDKSPA